MTEERGMRYRSPTLKKGVHFIAAPKQEHKEKELRCARVKRTKKNNRQGRLITPLFAATTSPLQCLERTLCI